MNQTNVTPAAMRIVRTLAGRPPQTMSDLIEATRVPRTAVTEQLQELVSGGYVERQLERVGRGRPRYLYSVSERALSTLFRNNQQLVAPALLQALAEVADRDTFQRVIQRVTELMADHYRQDITAPRAAERLEQLADTLRGEGVLVDLDRDSQGWILHERTCPFLGLPGKDRTICELETRMFSEVIGQPLELAACRLDDCPGCTFRLAADESLDISSN